MAKFASEPAACFSKYVTCLNGPVVTGLSCTVTSPNVTASNIKQRPKIEYLWI
ncbi:MAG: hypothetical protein QXI48_00340 [Candidatus Bathyarchaeia archaeon]